MAPEVSSNPMDTLRRLRITAARPSQYTRFLIAVLNVKGRSADFEESNRTQIELIDRALLIRGFERALIYINERFPEPALLPVDVQMRAAVRERAADLLDENCVPSDYFELPHFKRHRPAPFLFGVEPTFIDLALIAITTSEDDRFFTIHRNFNDAVRRHMAAQ
jgi:hypothetical protein